MTFLQILAILFSLLLYGALSFYIGYNGWRWLKSSPIRINKYVYILLILFLTSSYVFGRLLDAVLLELIGGFWFVVAGYSLILLPAANMIVFFLKRKNYTYSTYWTGVCVIASYLFIFGYGSFNAWSPTVRNFDLTVEKNAEIDELKILVVSDLHLGTIVGNEHLKRLTALSEEIAPDMILMPGDIINDDIAPYRQKGMGEELEKLEAPLGVFAVPGNHEYYGGDLKEIKIDLEQAGITVLMDEIETVNGMYIAGRKDLTDPERASVDELLNDLNSSQPIILLDHQPVEIDEAKDGGADILLSGHTHRGQVAPANIITSMIYENDWGYLKKDSLHSYVTSGFGTWGPPLRLGSRAEVMVINVTFED
ncbi:metallophosphoesterase [Jeotgalibacillus proteolyticus]|uniref:Phosphoesterase n=1 Tax=Jeotgalibacillus proteolyticus TaxID=2082395 RepID=A0A2S5GFT3_9BACL|nr:metallophosphoesterase [Jeotgalibacillus proteolyticus]PPA71856.1 phosphoesterase [Jeotgalibacillus proteolyticus]